MMHVCWSGFGRVESALPHIEMVSCTPERILPARLFTRRQHHASLRMTKVIILAAIHTLLAGHGLGGDTFFTHGTGLSPAVAV